MKRFKLFNNIVGWVVCAIACTVYLLTIEPTASFWDCGEFIATSYKMEIGHPPGAPFFMILGRICSLFASDPSHVAAMVNAFSAFCSGFTILFLFWTITHLARRIEVSAEDFKNDAEISLGKTIGILGAGAVGALAYTFSDTFWFSAVEGEVYASSSLFTAVVYWAMLKWEDVADEPYANRWLVLIAYLMGLSIGVHLLNLLSIPVLVLVYYYRKTVEPTVKGTIYALLLSCVILAAILYGLIPGFAQVAGWFELLFVNGFGLPYNTGVVIYALLLVGLLVYGIILTNTNGTLTAKTASSSGYAKQGDAKHFTIIGVFVGAIVLLGIPFFGSGTGGHIFLALVITAILVYALYMFGNKVSMAWLNTILLCCGMVLMGYSSYAPLVIRSAANPTMDENSPDDVFALKSYLNREQYGDRPLLYGESYAAEYRRVNNGNGQWAVDVENGEAQYAKAIKDNDSEPDSYVHYADKQNYKYCSEFNMLFPRMYSRQPNHISAYKEWGSIGSGKQISYVNMDQTHTATVPTQLDNLQFFFKYQVGFMYWRYFMWNFVGRQNDIQGNGESSHGNWCSGITFLDNFILGSNVEDMPDQLKNNKGRNCYYFLPLLLGLLGIMYQFSTKNKTGMQTFWQVCILFVLTGLAIVVYLNQTPYQPRERDYAYAGSFYAFAIWIGLGVMFFYDVFKKYIDAKIAATVATVACLGVPALMAQQNWDDHDRSNRYTCRDFGGDYLRSLAPNAIIFTNGDNDTFPLWYNQEVEGDCKDDSLKAQYQNKRVANLSYLQMAWYVAQMTRDAYDSKGFDLTLEEKDYSLGKLDVAYVVDAMQGASLSVNDVIKILKDPKIQTAVKRRVGMADDDAAVIPCAHLFLEVDSAEAVNNAGADPALIANELNRFRFEQQRGILANNKLSVAEKNAEIEKLRLSKTYHINVDLSNKRYLGKHEIFILDMLANNHWKRPVYYAVTVGGDSKLGLQPYFRLEGMAYRVMPYRCNSRCETSIMYDNLMHKFEFGNAGDPNVYLEENNLRMCSTFRNMFVMLAGDLYEEGKRDSSKKVLDYVMEKLPSATIPLGEFDLGLIDLYYRLGDTKTGDKYAGEMIKNCSQYLVWYASGYQPTAGFWDKNKGRNLVTCRYDFSKQRRLLATLSGLCKNYNRSELNSQAEDVLNVTNQAYQYMASLGGTVEANEVSYDEED